MNNQQKQQVIEQITQANNVLVAVSTNPTVDELTAAVGLTLILNKLNKHATTVFSGIVPSTIEFLQPEKTIETTTDSLRDFIIALDKSKADKLRYKVEDDVVRIFITPYQTSISEKDLQFSQGDFNVDVVLALGVTNREDLDKAITAHGRILHDATVVSLTAQNIISDLGSLKWQEPSASSLCEMIASMMPDLPQGTVDGQTATALLTGIIAETDRFRNEKTTPYTLTLGGQLMAAGANQQLIADKLEKPERFPEPTHLAEQRKNPDQELAEIAASVRNGELAINHEQESDESDDISKIHIDEHGNVGDAREVSEVPTSTLPQPPADVFLPVSGEGAEAPVEQKQTDQESNQFTETSETHQEGHPGDSLLKPPSSTPMMSHEKVIMPPSAEEMAKTDKPFDLQEAMRQASSDTAGTEVPRQKEARPGNPIEPVTVPPRLPDENSIPSSDSPVTPPPYYTEPDSSRSVRQSPVVQDRPNFIAPPWTPPPVKDEPKQQKTEEPSETADENSDKAAADSQTLVELEEAVGSKHILRDKAVTKSLSELEDEVAKAADAQESRFPTPTKSVGASTVDLNASTNESKDQPANPTAPPPVPPPMTPQFFDGDGSNNSPLQK